MTTPVLIALGAAVAAVVVFWAYRRFRTPAEKPYFHFRCPSCGRRLRYRARQVGHAGECSHCHRPLTFPPADPDT